MKKHLSSRILALVLSFIFLASALPLGTVATYKTTDDSFHQAENSTLEKTEELAFLSNEYEREDSFIREIPEMREENVKHFDKGDGTYEAVAYDIAVHRKDENGEWQDIDNSLVLCNERYISSDARISFAQSTLQDKAIWTLSENGYAVSLFLAETDLRSHASADVKNHPSRSELTEAAKSAGDPDAFFRVDNCTTVYYGDILAGVDLEYVLNGNAVKETILVKETRENYAFTFRLSLSGLIPELSENGSMLLYDEASGEAVYLIPAPYMIDAAGEYSDDVSYRFVDLGNGEYSLWVIASNEWINDPKRVFPVSIDPTLAPVSAMADSFISPTYTTSNYGSSVDLWVRNGATAFFQFSLPTSVTNASINSARLYVKYFYYVTTGSLDAAAYKVLGGWSENLITYNNAPQVSSTSISTATLAASSTITSTNPGTAYFTITNLVHDWYSDASTNYGVAITRVSGSNQSVILTSRESSSGGAYLSINYYPQAVITQGFYQIKNASTGKYLTVRGQGNTSGTIIEQNANSYGEHQQFLLKSLGGNEYIIQPVNALSMALSVANGSSGTEVKLASYNASDTAQRFYITQNDNSNNYVIKSKKSNCSNALSVQSGSNTNGLSITQQEYGFYLWQDWILEFAGSESGVYTLQKSGTTRYMYSNTSSLVYSYSIPLLSFTTAPNMSNNRPAFFKIHYRPDHQDYVIRSMFDNAVFVFPGINYTKPVSKRLYGVEDPDLNNSYAWKMTKAGANSYHLWIDNSGTRYYIASDTNNTLTFTTVRSDATKWLFSIYTGTVEEVMPYTVLDSHIVSADSSVDISILVSSGEYKYYSTNLQKNTPGTFTSYSLSNVSGTPTSLASIQNHILYVNPHKTGVVRVTVCLSDGLSFPINFYVVSPSDEFFLMQNVQSSGGITIGYAEGNSTGATKTAFPTASYLSGTSYNDTQLWQKIPTGWTGYYYIKNVGTGLYLSSPQSTTIGAALEMVSSPSTAYQAWEFSATVSGAWRIRSRPNALAGRNLYINVQSIYNNTLTQDTYVQNISFLDEFNILSIGSDVVYNRSLTWPTVIDPTEILADLAKYYESYTLIHNDIYMDTDDVKTALENSKIMIINGHGTPTSIAIHEYPEEYIYNSEIYDPTNTSNSLDLSNTAIVFFAGCRTGGNPCAYCDARENYDGHLPGCPQSGTVYYNLPKAAQYAGAKVAIGWTKNIVNNHANDWIEYFINLLNSVNDDTNELYTAAQAYEETNEVIVCGNANTAVLYGTDQNFKLSD